MKKRNSNSGFTLVELLITIAMFVIIISIAVGGFTNALRTQRQVASLISAQSNVSLALEQMTREVRTGYLFCHDQDISGATPNADCGCVITDSGYSPNPLPADPSDSIGSGNDLPLWTCSALDYYTADGTHVEYSLTNGALDRSVIGATSTDTESITGDNVDVHSLNFTLFGNIEGDYWTPRVTVSLGISPSSTDVATMNDVLNLQTTVSGRQVDCTTAYGPLAC